MKIEVVLTEAEIIQELTEAVEARDLPEKFFYWSPLAVRAWLARAADPAFGDLRRCWKELATKTNWLLEPFVERLPVISFGAGDGSTDRLLLDVFQYAGRELKYYPVDASQTLLETACAAAEDLDIETAGVKADISSPMHLVFATDAAESPKLLLMSGNTLGGFDPLDHVKHMAQCLHGDDRLILDAEIYHTNGSAPDIHAMVQFAFAPLAALGVSADDGEVRFEHKRDKSIGGLHVTASYFRPDRDLRIATPAHEVLVERGEHINLNFNYRFTADALHALLVERGGLRILEEIPSLDGRYMLVVCSR
ncbi:MAG TPA: L-histidine N(alpha)-methyltransferase [Bryobacteraceae bacterium]|nr:L-histidine N(alpha)-methyltransferase [Bryobacteraceae bacterium]